MLLFDKSRTVYKFFIFTEKYTEALKQQEEDEEEEEDDEEGDDVKVKPTPQKRPQFFDQKSYQKPKWDEDNGNGGPGGMGARCGITIA